jgi:hypothetical protein
MNVTYVLMRLLKSSIIHPMIAHNFADLLETLKYAAEAETRERERN